MGKLFFAQFTAIYASIGKARTFSAERNPKFTDCPFAVFKVIASAQSSLPTIIKTCPGTSFAFLANLRNFVSWSMIYSILTSSLTAKSDNGLEAIL